MDNNTNQLSPLDFLVESHVGLQRQGPGSAEMTTKALGFLDNLSNVQRAVDFGCGTGGQTMIIAQNIPGTVVGVDQFQPFIDAFNDNAAKLGLQQKARGIVGSMEDFAAEKESFDLVWSEGVIDAIGFEKGLRYWHGFLKKSGALAVTCPSWFTDEKPGEVAQFWAESGSELNAVDHNIEVMQKAGYAFVASFALPQNCWTEEYFAPRGALVKKLQEKYADDKTVEEMMAQNQREETLYEKYKQHYGYAFYIGKKI